MLEPNIFGLWGKKQTAKGTPADMTTLAHRLPWLGGDMAMPRDEGATNTSDLTKYGTQFEWLNSLLGNGEPAVAATPEEMAWLLWIAHGAETVTSVTGPPTAQKHTFVPSTGRGFYAGFLRRLGLSIIDRKQFDDSLIARWVIEGSTAQKDVRITPRILSLDPGVIKTADGGAPFPSTVPFYFTDGAGTFAVDGAVFRGNSQFAITGDEDLQPQFGDDVTPEDLSQGRPSLGLGVTLLMTQQANDLWNTKVYGSATPVAGTKPRKQLSALGSYLVNLVQKDPTTGAANGKRFNALFPNVKWTLPDYPGPNPDGGPTEIALAGVPRQVGVTPAYTIDVYTDNTVTAFTV